MTTKDVIKLLPMDNKLKMQVLNMYDYMEPDVKRTVQRIAWKTYFYMYNQQVQANIDKQFESVEEGKATFGKEFYQEVAKKTDHEMNKQIGEKSGAVDLAAARNAMEQIMKEISATKKVKKLPNS
jgi:hypothetical protein